MQPSRHMMSKKKSLTDVNATSVRCHFDVMCPLGCSSDNTIHMFKSSEAPVKAFGTKNII